MNLKFWKKKENPAEAILKASATVRTPEIPLPSNNPEWERLKVLTHKLDLAAFDAELARKGYAVNGQLRKAVKLKYEKS
jgi:hypothetical protein